MFTPNIFVYFLKRYDGCLLFLPNDKQKRYSSIIDLSYFILVTKVCRDDIFVVWN